MVLRTSPKFSVVPDSVVKPVVTIINADGRSRLGDYSNSQSGPSRTVKEADNGANTKI